MNIDMRVGKKVPPQRLRLLRQNPSLCLDIVFGAHALLSREKHLTYVFLFSFFLVSFFNQYLVSILTKRLIGQRAIDEPQRVAELISFLVKCSERINKYLIAWIFGLLSVSYEGLSHVYSELPEK